MKRRSQPCTRRRRDCQRGDDPTAAAAADVSVGGHTLTEVVKLMEVSDLMQEAVTLRLMAKALTEVLAMLRLPPLSLSSASSLSG